MKLSRNLFSKSRRPNRRVLSASAAAAALAVGGGFIVAHPATARPVAVAQSAPSSVFSVRQLSTYPTLPDARLKRTAQRLSAHRVNSVGIGLSLRDVPETGPAIIDESVADSGFATATTAHSVELSWVPTTAATVYEVVRNGHVIGRVSGTTGYFDDTTVSPNRAYEYRVTPERGSSAQQSWGTRISVPAAATSSAGRLSALRKASMQQAAAIVTGATTTPTWVAFIPEQFVQMPPKPDPSVNFPCDYGSAYEFGGDNHGFNWQSSNYRVALSAVINWNAATTAQLVSSYPSVHASHVYKKSTGALVETKTASASGLVARYAGNGPYNVEVSMQLDAANPFCHYGEIDGGLTIMISETGSWSIISGSVKPMPDHLIYLYNNGHETEVWRGQEVSEICLMGEAACGSYTLTGTGTFS